MKNKNIFIIITMIIGLMVVGCSNTSSSSSSTSTSEQIAVKNTSYPLTIVDSYNRTVTIEKEPKRVITIAPNIAETVYALDKGTYMVGRSDYEDFPAEVTKVASVGGLTQPNLEKIVELKPDVVIVSTHFSKDVITTLESLNIKVVALYGEENFDGVYNTITKVGEVLNANAKASEIISTMKKKVETITSKLKSSNNPSVYYVVGFGKDGDYTAGGDTFIGNMIEMAGGKNAAGDVKGWQYSVEKLVQNNPDILICSKYYESKKGIEATTGYKDLKAVKEGKLIEVDNNLLDRQGPRLADGLEALAKIIHPELFK